MTTLAVRFRSTHERRMWVRSAAVDAFLTAVLPAAVVFVTIFILAHGGGLFDFRIFSSAGQEILDGHSPWDAFGFRYPAAAAVSFVPFAALPFGVAAALFCLLNALGILVVLWLLGVRDWRCYTISFASTPVFMAIADGTISVWIALCVALAWKYRDRPALSGTAIGLGIALKLLLWPLAVWLLVTRRYRCTVFAAAAAIILSSLSWLIVGFSTLRDFLRVLNPDIGAGTYSLYALGRALGFSTTSATILMFAAAALLAVCAFIVRRRNDGDWSAFIVGIGICLVASSWMHVHYLVVLLVPLAVSRPRISRLWAAPLLYSLVAHAPGGEGSVPRIAAVLMLTGFVLASSTRRHGEVAYAEPRIQHVAPGLEPT